MKRILIAFPLLAGASGAASVAGTSQFAGSQTKIYYDELLVDLNATFGWQFINERYDIGLTHSQAVTRVMGCDAVELFSLHHDISHAALSYTHDGLALGSVNINTSLHEQQVFSDEIMSIFGKADPFQLFTQVSFNGDIRNSLTINDIHYKNDDIQISWTGLTLQAVRNGRKVDGGGSLGSLVISEESTGSLVSTQASHFDFDLNHQGSWVYTGDSKLRINGLTLVDRNLPAPVVVGSVQFASSSGISAAIIDGVVQMDVNSVHSPWAIDNAFVKWGFGGVKLEGLYQLTSANTFSLASPGNVLSAMFEPGAFVKNTVSLAGGDGELNAGLKVGLKQDNVNAKALPTIATGRDLLDWLIFEADFKADAPIMANSPLAQLLGSGPLNDHFTVKNKLVSSTVELDGTSLLVNDAVLPLEFMSHGLLDAPLENVATVMHANR